MITQKIKTEKFSITKRIKSFKYAINGIWICFLEEHNARVHFVAAIVVVIAGFFFKISLTEWMAIIYSEFILHPNRLVSLKIKNINANLV